MSCYDWRRLLAHRFDSALDRPRQWRRARKHLEECEICRREALAVDPTLVFRQATTWVPEPGDTETIRTGVRTLRRTGALSTRAAAADRGSDRGVGHGRAMAALLWALALTLLPGRTVHNPIDQADLTPTGSGAQLLRVAGPAAPAIEGIDRPDARIYEWGADDLSVVMVVDESLDV